MSPSMFPGKKGFERLVYAAKNAFNTPVTWLFYNISESIAPFSYILIENSRLTSICSTQPRPARAPQPNNPLS